MPTQQWSQTLPHKIDYPKHRKRFHRPSNQKATKCSIFLLSQLTPATISFWLSFYLKNFLLNKLMCLNRINPHLHTKSSQICASGLAIVGLQPSLSVGSFSDQISFSVKKKFFLSWPLTHISRECESPFTYKLGLLMLCSHWRPQSSLSCYLTSFQSLAERGNI